MKIPTPLRWSGWIYPRYLVSLSFVMLLRYFPWPQGRGRYWVKRVFQKWIYPHFPVPMATDQGWLFLLPQEDILQKKLSTDGSHYEKQTVSVLDQVIRPGMTVFDIGGHVGYYTMALARRVGPSGRVIVFEP